MQTPQVAVVIPFFQREPGILVRAVNSALSQSVAERLLIIIVDDGSPIAATSDLQEILRTNPGQILIIPKSNGGAGSARNVALNHVPSSVEYVAFLDSDDCWRPRHIENALHALELGYDFYFSDHMAALHEDESNFCRIGTLTPEEHTPLDDTRNLYQMDVPILDHIVGDGGGVIGTSNVVYRFRSFPDLRFREEYYNGQDFFFWMDLGELGVKAVFSTLVDCDCGRGVNIYSSSGWGTDLALQRIRNELKVWLDVERIYHLSSETKIANRHTIKNLQDSAIRDLLHRLANGKQIHWSLVADVFRMAPDTIFAFPRVIAKIVMQKVAQRDA